jgi:hypothetical protein
LFHLNPRKEPEKVMLKTKKLLEEIWRCSRELQMTEESGRVGEALGVSGPSRKGRVKLFETRHRAGCPAKAGVRDMRRRLPRP